MTGAVVLAVVAVALPAGSSWEPRPDPYDPHEAAAFAKRIGPIPTIPRRIRYREYWPVPWPKPVKQSALRMTNAPARRPGRSR